MKIENLKISEIKPYEKNPRKNEKAVEIVMRSIKEFGFKVPIILDKNNIIIAGHTRLKAATRLGMKTVPVIRANELNEEQVKAFRIMDNKSYEYAEWDFKLLRAEVEDLKEIDYDLDLTGLTSANLHDLDTLLKDNINVIPKEVKYKIKKGEIWQLDNHRVMCGDSTKEEDFNKLMNGELAALVFTDPPYNINYRPYGFRGSQDAYSAGRYTHKKVFSDNLKPEEYEKLILECSKNCHKYTREKAAMCMWSGDKNLHIIIQANLNARFVINQLGAWVKNSLTFSPGCTFHKIMEYCVIAYKNKHRPHINKRYVRDKHNLFDLEFKNFLAHLEAWHLDRGPTKEYRHPTQKPVELTYPALYAFTEKGDIILDCFGGSGSTLLACQINERAAYVMELDPYYCSIIIQRWEELTKKKAKKVIINKKSEEK